LIVRGQLELLLSGQPSSFLSNFSEINLMLKTRSNISNVHIYAIICNILFFYLKFHGQKPQNKSIQEVFTLILRNFYLAEMQDTKRQMARSCLVFTLELILPQMLTSQRL